MKGHLPKTKPVDSRAAVAEYARTHPFCLACGCEWRVLQTHHILGGRAGRSDEACNLIRLCAFPCHLLAESLDVRGTDFGEVEYRHLPKITDAIAIAMKIRCGELTEYDLDRLEQLNLRPLPDPEPIPSFFVRLWKMNRPELNRST